MQVTPVNNSLVRFKDPQPFTYADNSVVNATEFGPQCPQFPIPDEPMGEDCLTLNVYRPVSVRCVSCRRMTF